MNTRIRWWMTAAVISIASLAAAAPVPLAEVADAARGWMALMNGEPLEEKIQGELAGIETATDSSGQTLFYVFLLSGNGILVMAPDDEIEPVIAFSSDAGEWSDPDPCNHFRLLLEADMRGRLRSVRLGEVKSEGSQRAKWLLLRAAARDAEEIKVGLSSVWDLRVEPLVQSRWNQKNVIVNGVAKAVYNFYTPKYNPGNPNNYYCGCIPTALAQLMRYHQHPTTAVGTRSFPIWVDGIGTTRALRGGDGAGGPYKWWAMPLNPDALGSNLTDVQRKAIGALCHDVGVASQAEYTKYGTAAYLCWSAGFHPLQTVFHYANVESPWVNVWETFSKDTINQALNPNLDARLPCAITINGPDGGHAVVVDGYGYAYGALYHHLNFGWGGPANAWYNLPNNVNTKYQANLVIGMVFNLHPAESNFHILSGRVLNLNGKPMADVKVTARNLSTGTTYSRRTNARGIYAIRVPRYANYEVKAKAVGVGFTPKIRNVTMGLTVARNVWGVNYKAVTRIMALPFSSMKFGPVPVEESLSRSVTVQNTGTAKLSVTRIECPAGFSAFPQTFEIPAGGSATFKVKFTPVAMAFYEGTVILRSDRTSGNNQIAVQGRGI